MPKFKKIVKVQFYLDVYLALVIYHSSLQTSIFALAFKTAVTSSSFDRESVERGGWGRFNMICQMYHTLFDTAFSVHVTCKIGYETENFGRDTE